MLANRSGVCRKHLTALRHHLHHLLQGLKVPVGHRRVHQRPHPSAGCSSGEQGGRYSRSTPPAPPPAGRPATPPDPAPPSSSPRCPSHLPTGSGWPRPPAPQSYRRGTIGTAAPPPPAVAPPCGPTPSATAASVPTGARQGQRPEPPSPPRPFGRGFFIGLLRRRVPYRPGHLQTEACGVQAAVDRVEGKPLAPPTAAVSRPSKDRRPEAGFVGLAAPGWFPPVSAWAGILGMAAVAQGLWALLVIALHSGVHRVVSWAISRAPNPLWAW